MFACCFFSFLLKSCVLLASLVEFFWSVALLRSNCCSTLFVMAEEHIWIFAQILHPFKLGTYFQASWPETRHPGVAGAGASSPLALTQGLLAQAPGGAAMAGVHPATRMNVTVGVVSLRRGCLDVRSFRRRPDEPIPTTPNVQLPPGISSLPTSDVDGSLFGFRWVDCSLRLRADDAFSSCREDDSNWVDAWCIQQSCQASRRVTFFNDCEPTAEFWTVCSGGLPCLPLKSDQPNMRPIDKLQILSWNTGPARGSDRSLLASHLNGPWHVICEQELSGFVTDSSLRENFHVVIQHHSAVLLNTDTYEYDISCTPILIPLFAALRDMGC